MIVLVDASVLLAMLTDETDGPDFADIVEDAADPLCCSVGLWEAARAFARKRRVTATEAMNTVDELRVTFGIRIVSVGEREARLALRAHDIYGKGTGHPAKLNMGDCFAYACAKAHDARLLYKGDDFAHTDLA